MTPADLQQSILDLVNADNYQPVKPKVLAKKLGLDKEQQQEARRIIKQLVKQGRLAFGANHAVRRPGAVKASDVLTGVFQRTASGNGFVRPRVAGVARPPREADIFVPRRAALDASTGDLVLVRLVQPRGGPEGRRQGEITEVLERDTHQFVGTYLDLRGQSCVQIDGKVFSEPIPVGDPGAKGAQPSDKVVVELVRFPSHRHPGEGVIIEVLGPRGAPGVDTLSIIREYALPQEFPEDVLAAAREMADAFDETDLADRADLTASTIITIDPVDARDFDDAISLAQQENGHWLLGVHIADVSHFVRPKSALDREARERGTSVYLPDRVLPMLPEVISNHLASLQPDRVRYTQSVFIEFTPEGIPVSTEIQRSAIRSCRRFAYEEVDEFLADAESWRTRLTPEVFRLLADMHQLAMVLRRRRLEGGAIELTLPEVKIDLDRDGRVAGAHLVAHTESHQIIEEFMLAANEAVATWLRDRELLFLRRIHGAPDPRKLQALTQFVRELGLECQSMESRFEIKRVVESVRERPERHAVNYAVLRSMQKAVYSPEEEGHYALNSQNYCHFTSPIRRYPDLTVHRLLDQLARGKRPPQSPDQLATLAEHCSQREQRAEAAERELVKVKLLDYLSKRRGEKLQAVITGVEEFGLFAQGIDLPAEGLVHVSSLQDDFYRYDSDAHSLVGSREGNYFRLGDLVEVEVFRVDIDRRELDFRLVRRLERPAASRSRPAREAPAGGRRPPKKKTSPTRPPRKSRRRP